MEGWTINVVWESIEWRTCSFYLRNSSLYIIYLLIYLTGKSQTNAVIEDENSCILDS